MYLSELFLSTLEGDYSISSVRNAIEVCNDEYKEKEDFIQFSELMDFWDVYKEFDGALDETEKDQCQLLKKCISVF